MKCSDCIHEKPCDWFIKRHNLLAMRHKGEKQIPVKEEKERCDFYKKAREYKPTAKNGTTGKQEMGGE